MFRLIAVTLAVFYMILLVFGDETRRPEEVARAEPLTLNLIQAAYLPDSTPVLLRDQTGPLISDTEAVKLALAAGEKIRAERKRAPLRGTNQVVSLETRADAVENEAEAPTEYWTVTGSRVNLRMGPGTSNAVIGQLVRGDQAYVLADENGWYQIQSADGVTSGWIFGKFLRPG